MKRVVGLLLFLMLITAVESFSHNKTIKGRVHVKNGNEEPIVGARVKLQGTVLGAVTNSKGEFIIKAVPDGNFVIIVNSIGMNTIRKDIELKHIDGDEYIMDIHMEENPVKVSNIVVTATKSEKVYDDIPIKVSTITEADINISSSNNLRESLQFQPGVRTEVNCQNCGFSQVRINGLDGKYSQILIDGRAIFSSLNGVYGLDQIPTNMIDRVEVIRGGASSLYGGNAIAGVINVITKTPYYNSYDVSWNNFMIDNKFPENILTLNGNLVSEEQNVGISIFGMKNDRHQFDANSDGYTEIGKMNILTFGSKLFYKVSPKLKITTEINNINHKIRGGNKINLQPHQSDITEMAEHRTLMGQISAEQYVGIFNKFTCYFSLQNTDRNSYYGSNKDINAYGKTDNRTISTGINYSHIYVDFIGDHNLIAGYEFSSDEVNDIAVKYNRVIEQKTISNGFYLQDDWMLNEKMNFLIGTRIDNHNLIDNLVVNPRFSFLFKLLSNLSLRGTYSTGYRAPQAFDEDLHKTQVGGQGIVIFVDKKLRPEYSKSFSFSADYSTNLFLFPIGLSLEYFNTKLEDAFSLTDKGSDNNGNRILLRENSESARVNGLTLEIQSNYKDNFYLKLGFTAQKSVFANEIGWSSGDDLMGIAPQFSENIFRTPDKYGYFLLNLQATENLNFDISGYYTGPMYVPHYSGYISTDELKVTKSFFDLNVKVTFTLMQNPNIKISFGVQNILNSYQDDFDKGINRDAGYIYGPFRPFSTNFKVSFYY